MKPKVSVIGVGRLGLSFALLLDSKGYDVVGCDVNERYIDALGHNTFISKEPFINGMMDNTNIIFTTDVVKALNHGEIIFVFVQTPSKEGGNYDHKYVDQVVSKVKYNSVGGKTLVIGCTVMPTYCSKIQDDFDHCDVDVSVMYNPEFIAQGSIVDGLRKADIVLIGGNRNIEAVQGIYRNIMDKEPNFKCLSLTGAEITKISINCFLTLKIAFANMIGEIATNSNEERNIESIMDAIGSDSRIGKKYLSYGFPAGGVCLPRDQKALTHHAHSVGIQTKYTNAIDEENERHSDYLTNYYIKQNPYKNIPFIFSYLGYKEGVDILTHSYQLKVCINLLREGYKVNVPLSVKEMDTPEEFKDYVYNDMVSFGEYLTGYKIN